MKVYVISREDIEALLVRIDRNPEYGREGGSSSALNDTQRKAHEEAHRFVNYHVRTWLSKVTQGDF